MHGIIYITECQGQEFWSSWKGQLWTAVGRRNEILKRCPEEGHARRRQMQKGSFRLNVFSRLKLPSPLQFPQTAQPISQNAKQIQNRLLPQGRNLAFLRKGLEGVSTTQCGTFLLVGEFVQLLNWITQLIWVITIHLSGTTGERREMTGETGGRKSGESFIKR